MLLIFAFGAEAGWKAQTSTGGERPHGESNALCLELTPGQTRVHLGEPLVVAASLRNCSAEPRQLEDLLAPAYGFLQLSLSGPGGGNPIRWRPPVRRDARGKRPRRLDPGERMTVWVPLYADAGGWALSRPGEYVVRAEYVLGGGRVAALPLRLTVTAPETQEEANAASLLMDQDSAVLLSTGHEGKGGGSARLSRLLKDFPESPLAPYASTALGISRMKESFDPELKTFRTADCEAAVAALGPSATRVADPFFSAVGTVSLATCLRKLGRESAARTAIEGYSKAHPGGEKLPGVFEVLHGLNGHPQAVRGP